MILVIKRLPVIVFVLFLGLVSSASADSLFLSPRGSDANSGTRAAPLRTLDAAWRKIPSGQSGRWTLNLDPGDYTRGAPVYWENKRGSILIRSAPGRARLSPMNVYKVEGLTLKGLSLKGGGDVFHCERCRRLVLDGVRLTGQGAQEVVKVNQSTDVTVKNSRLWGGGDNAFDAVAVGRLSLLNNRIGGAEDWCAYAKGGSYSVVVRGNVFERCGTGGFSAGQGTGLQFMQPPFFHYEVYGALIEDNTARDLEGAGFGVQGGYNVLVRNNVLHEVGERSHSLEVVYGSRSCDGQPGDQGRERCAQYLAAGAWGTQLVDDGTNFVPIPNRHVYVWGNAILNSKPSRWQVFQLNSDRPASLPSGLSSDLVFAGNLIFDGKPDQSLGLEGCDCRFLDSNRIARPSLRRLASGRLKASGLPGAPPPPLPDWSARPASTPSLWSSWPGG